MHKSSPILSLFTSTCKQKKKGTKERKVHIIATQLVLDEQKRVFFYSEISAQMFGEEEATNCTISGSVFASSV